MTKVTIMFLISLMVLKACGQTSITTPHDALTKFDIFKKKNKFAEDHSIFYPGLSKSSMLPILTEKINLAADDFRKLAQTGSASKKEYQEKIRTGLDRFSDIYDDLDTEDRERVCLYFEELMEIIGLENSGGYLNNFSFGFDPTKRN